MHIFCDESGNTGSDLLNREQPIFSIASTCIDRETAERLISQLRRQGQKEVKYSRLRGTASGQALIINFLSSPELVRTTSKVVMADKLYYLITHLVDKLIEPTLHEKGFDLYAQDRHVFLTNIWYYNGKRFFPNGHWKKVLSAFTWAIRSCSKEAFENFDNILLRAARDTPVDYRDFVNGLLLACGRLDEFIGIYKGGVVFDPSPDLLTCLTHKWMEEFPGRFSVTHDKSKPLLQNEAFFRALMKEAPNRTIGYGARQVELPLRISEFGFGDSHEYPQLQVADVIAGASIDAFLALSGKKHMHSYHVAMKETHLGEMLVEGMLPSFQFEMTESPAAREINLVDGSAAFLKEIGYSF